MISILVNILIVVAILGFLIFIHELGHFLAAKFLGVRVDEFSIGFGPKLFSRKFGEVEFKLCLLPIGGYVKILGENKDDIKGKEKEDPRNFQNKPVWVRIVILMAGVFMNLVFALSVYQYFIHSLDYKWEITSDFADFELVSGETVIEKTGELEYEGLVEDSGAQKAEIPDKGVIKKINGSEIVYSYSFRELVTSAPGENLVLNICETDVCSDYTVHVSDEGKVGIYLKENYRIYWDYSKNKVLAGGSHALNMVKLAGERLGEMFSEAKSTGDYSEVSASVSGPIGVYIIVDVFKQYGFLSLLGFTADFSLTLVIMNLLPIPALDGGRILLLLIEGIMRKPINRKFEAFIINTSFFLLLLLMVVILFKDIFFFDELRSMFN